MATLKTALPQWAVVVGLAAFVLPVGHAAGEATGLEPCLNYFTVGVSGCVPEKISPTATPKRVTPTVQVINSATPTVVAPAGPPTLDTKIDEFLEDHGKPPREFVAFYLEPNAENAMKWISKYNELVDRNIQLTIAWEQAEVLYKQELASGTLPSALVSSTLPPVPNFGVSVPGFTDNPALANTTYPGFGSSMFIAPPPAIPGIDPKNGTLGSMPLATVNTLGADGRLGGNIAAPMPQLLAPSATLPTTPQGLPLVEDLTYYYSDVCPYCKRFNPELAKAMEGTNLTIACVDLSPKNPGPHTVPTGIPCKWRSPTEGELTAQNVRQTPTLLMRGPGGYPLRVSGYVDENRLQSYLNAAGLLAPPSAE